MGKRASRKPPPKKKIPKVPTTFDCPFCNHENSVNCIIDTKKGYAQLKCRICAATHQMKVHHLHEPIDVYADWIDCCQKENTALAESTPSTRTTTTRTRANGSDHDNDNNNENDDILNENIMPATKKARKGDDEEAEDEEQYQEEVSPEEEEQEAEDEDYY
eukprot:GEZU01004171.1.p1 GENE.GEZU01004171.1~~GEZU01004171.1.p1  ORF type:complete len:161 (-),score=48.61 GEZU01004171.1:73-555(-)